MRWVKNAPFPTSSLAMDVRLENGQNPPLYIYKEVVEELRYLGVLDAMFQDQSKPDSTWRTLEDERFLLRLKWKNDFVERIRLYDKQSEFHRIRLILSYDGTAYSGFQIQPGLKTVSQELHSAVAFVNDYQTKIVGASRTDEGVHALGQCVHFDTFHSFSPFKWKEILNHRLPRDIHVIDVFDVDGSFHARYDVVSKTYEYRLNFGEFNPIRRHLEWTVPRVDADILNRILQDFVGTHDFTSFCTHQKENKVRTVLRAEARMMGHHCILTFEARGFLHHMIRLIVSTSLRIARGELRDSVSTLLAAKSRHKTTHIAPSCGLTLVDITYTTTHGEEDGKDEEDE